MPVTQQNSVYDQVLAFKEQAKAQVTRSLESMASYKNAVKAQLGIWRKAAKDNIRHYKQLALKKMNDGYAWAKQTSRWAYETSLQFIQAIPQNLRYYQQRAYKKIRAAYHQAKQAFVWAYESSMQFLQALPQNMRAAFDWCWDKLVSGFKQGYRFALRCWSNFQWLLSNIGTWIVNALKALKRGLHTLARAIWDGLKAFPRWLVTTFRNAYREFVKGFRQVYQVAKKILSGLRLFINDIGRLLLNMLKGLKRLCIEGLKAVYRELKAFPRWLYNVARHMGTYLMNALRAFPKFVRACFSEMQRVWRFFVQHVWQFMKSTKILLQRVATLLLEQSLLLAGRLSGWMSGTLSFMLGRLYNGLLMGLGGCMAIVDLAFDAIGYVLTQGLGLSLPALPFLGWIRAGLGGGLFNFALYQGAQGLYRGVQRLRGVGDNAANNPENPPVQENREAPARGDEGEVQDNVVGLVQGENRAVLNQFQRAREERQPEAQAVVREANAPAPRRVAFR